MTSESDGSNNTSFDHPTQSLEDIILKLTKFQPGDSQTTNMPPTKRGRKIANLQSSPPEAACPRKSAKVDSDEETARSIRASMRSRSLGRTINPSKDKPKKEAATKSKDLCPPPPPIPSTTTTESTSSDSISQTPGESNSTTSLTSTKSDNPTEQPTLPPPQQELHGTFYSVDSSLINYLLGATNIRPSGFSQTMKLWYTDMWEHLENPPSELTNTMFIFCIPSHLSNIEKTKLLMKASNNLATARLIRDTYRPGSELVAKDIIDWLPFPQLLTPSTQMTMDPDDKLARSQNLEATKEFLDAVKVLQKDIDRNAFLFRTVCTDTSQGLRESGTRMMSEVREVMAAVAQGTTPLSIPAPEIGTTMPPPSVPKPPLRKSDTKPRKLLSIHIKE